MKVAEVAVETSAWSATKDDTLTITLNDPILSNVSLESILLRASIKLSVEHLNFLVEHGAVYTKVCQLPQKTFRQKQNYYNVNAPVTMHRYCPQLSSDGLWLLPQGTVAVKFYLAPQVFVLTKIIQWSSVCLYQDANFIFVNKPSGYPSEPVVSNSQECLHAQVGKHYGLQLYPLHRLDFWVGGVVCLGKSKESARTFQRSVVKKTYRLLVVLNAKKFGSISKRISIAENGVDGEIHHWMPRGKNFGLLSPRFIRKTKCCTWKECRSRIIKFNLLNYTDIVLCVQKLHSPFKDELLSELITLASTESELQFYDVTVALLTGRTHQLRAQFAAAGLPIVCDSLYSPLAGVTVDHINLLRIESLDFYDAVVKKEEYVGPELTPSEADILERAKLTCLCKSPIGLQCHTMGINHIEITAGEPWWMGETC